jgi:uncharacterized protein
LKEFIIPFMENQCMEEREKPAKIQKKVRGRVIRPIYMLESRRGQELYIRLHDALVGVPGHPDWEKARKAINAGADIECVLNELSKTPLICAAIYGNVETCALLLNKGAEIDAVDSDGSTALTSAAIMGRLEVCRLLIKKGANVNAKNNYVAAPLAYAASGGRTEICRLLVSKGADIDNANIPGRYTALMSAAEHGKAETCRALLGMGADMDVWDRDGETAFMHAATEGNPKTCKVFLDYGADVNGRQTEYPPLKGAASKGNMKTCVFLLENGANLYLAYKYGCTAAADVAKDNNHKEMSGFLRIMETLGKDAVKPFLSSFRECVGQ